MTPDELLLKLIAAVKLADAEQALADFLAAHSGSVSWQPVGRDNNAATIEAAGDPGRSVIERITNAMDAIIEREHAVHHGRPDCRSPREAAQAWLNVPSGGLSALSQGARQSLAKRVVLRTLPGEGKDSRLVEIVDQGIGIQAQDLPATILSLNESNKMRKPYLAGAYGQGGSSTFAVSKLTLIASRKGADSNVGFTIVRYEEAPVDDYAKLGRYVYLLVDNQIPAVDVGTTAITCGTVIRHWGYDLTEYPSPLGPNSVYGLLNQILFDPVLPVWFDNQIHDYRRVIKGSRNALNGAQDEGEEGSSRSDLAHNQPLFSVELGADLGRIGVEYWVVKAPTKENKRPAASFINPYKPIILTINGQNHAELPQSLIKKDADLPYLANRIICHIDCNGLSAQTKRALFVSNREDVRRGAVYGLLNTEIVRILKSDEDLVRLNEEARQQGMRERDATEVQQIRNEVARLLHMQGVTVGLATGSSAGPEGDNAANRGGGHGLRPKPVPIPFAEPPTFVRLVGDPPFKFFPGQRRYLRIETDAHSGHHNSTEAGKSDFNFIGVPGTVDCRGSTDLVGGRMRVVFECSIAAEISQVGRIRIELRRAGLGTLSAEQDFVVVAPPPEKQATTQLTLPKFDVVPVKDLNDPMWATLNWPDAVTEVASSAQMDGEVLKIYYSELFPKFHLTRESFLVRDAEKGKSYVKRYEIWLAVHSLMLKESESKTQPSADGDTSAQEDWERKERCRVATLSAMFALREVEADEATAVAED